MNSQYSFEQNSRLQLYIIFREWAQHFEIFPVLEEWDETMESKESYDQRQQEFEDWDKCYNTIRSYIVDVCLPKVFR